MFLISSCSCICPIHWSQVLVDNEDVVGAAQTGDAPTTSEWSTILLRTKVRLILETLRYVQETWLCLRFRVCVGWITSAGFSCWRRLQGYHSGRCRTGSVFITTRVSGNEYLINDIQCFSQCDNSQGALSISHIINRWVNARKTQLQCNNTGVTPFLH